MRGYATDYDYEKGAVAVSVPAGGWCRGDLSIPSTDGSIVNTITVQKRQPELLRSIWKRRWRLRSQYILVREGETVIPRA